MALASARRHYERQRAITVRGVAAAARARRGGRLSRVAGVLAAFQTLAVREAQRAAQEALEEQAIPTEAVAVALASGLVGGSAQGGTITEALQGVWSAAQYAFDRLVATELQDAGRNASGIETVIRPAVTGHVRYLQPPSCGRCAVLAGRWYRWSEGFRRHELCDCVMLPTNETPAEDLVVQPMTAFRNGQIRGMSQADIAAVNSGADLAQVVNVRSKRAGITRAGRVLERQGRPTPERIFQTARDRQEAIDLLTRFGYIR